MKNKRPLNPTFFGLSLHKTPFVLHLFLSIMITGAALTGSAQLKLTDTLNADTGIRIGTLHNGLTYYIRRNVKPAKSAELRLVVKTGSVNEDDDQQGLAHMLEHMAFNGTKNFKHNDIISYLQKIGVEYGNDLNAYTSFNETVYQLPIPLNNPGNLEAGFQILEDWAHQISNLTEAVNNERNIILEESRMGRGAEDRMFRKIYPRLLAGSRYASRLPIGIDSLIKNASPDALRRYYSEWYRPELMGVFVIGDINPEAIEALVKKHFNSLSNPVGGRSPMIAEIPAYPKNEAILATDHEATAYSTMMAWSAVRYKEPVTVEDYKNDLATSICLMLLNQRLRELTQKENPAFLGAGVDYSVIAKGYKQFSLNIYSGNLDINAATRAALQVLVQAGRFGFEVSEIERARRIIMAGYENSYKERNNVESVDYTEEYLRNFLTNEPIPGIEKEYDIAKYWLPRITPAEINQLAEAFTGKGQFFMALTGPPENNTFKLPTPHELLTNAEAVFNDHSLSAYTDEKVAGELMAIKPTAGKVVKETTDDKMGTKTWHLTNGITVTLKNTSFKTDQVLLSARRAGGSSNYDAADKLNARYAIAAVNSMGLAAFSPQALQKILSGKIASASFSMGAFTDGFSGSSSVSDVETLFQLVYLRATAPRVDTALFKAFIQKNKSQVSFAMADPQNVFIDTLIKTIYGNHPLAPITYPDAADFDRISLSRCLSIYNERAGDASNMHFVLVGALDESALKPLVETYLGGLPCSGRKMTFVDQGLRPVKGKKELLVEKGSTDKALVLVMQTGKMAYTEDLELKAAIIGELLTMKIDEVLREKLQAVYSGAASLTVNRLPYGNFQLLVQLPCNPEKTTLLVNALNREISKLKTYGPTISDLQKIRKQWIESNKISMQDNGSWLAHLIDNCFSGVSHDRFLHFDSYLNRITPTQIKVVANELLNGKNTVTAILKPAHISQKVVK